MRERDIHSPYLGARVSKLIELSGHNIEAIAFEMNISASQLRRLINGDSQWKLEHLMFASEYFSVTIDYLVYGEAYASKETEEKELEAKIRRNLEELSATEKETRERILPMILRNFATMFD